MIENRFLFYVYCWIAVSLELKKGREMEALEPLKVQTDGQTQREKGL